MATVASAPYAVNQDLITAVDSDLMKSCGQAILWLRWKRNTEGRGLVPARSISGRGSPWDEELLLGSELTEIWLHVNKPRLLSYMAF